MATKNCIRCGRALTNPVSQKAGYGPVCLRKVRREEIRDCLEAEVVLVEKGKNEQIRELKAEVDALKILVHNKLAVFKTQQYNAPPSNPSSNGNGATKIPLMGADVDLNELRDNTLFQQYAAISNEGMVA